MAGPFTVVPDSRPIVTTLRRRRGNKKLLCGVHLSFTDGSACTVWRTLIGVTTSHKDVDAATNSLDTTVAMLIATLDSHSREALVSLHAHLHRFHNLAARREHALVGALETERARLSAAVLQRSLFDRRSDRQFAAQTAILEEALQKCRVRLAEIDAVTRIAAEPGQLAFVLIRR